MRLLNGYLLIAIPETDKYAVDTGENEEVQSGVVEAVSAKYIQNGNMFLVERNDVKPGDKVTFLKHRGLDTPKSLVEENKRIIHILDVMMVEESK